MSAEGAEYYVARADMRRVRLRMFWKDAADQPISAVSGQAFEAVEATVRAQGEQLLLAANGGAFNQRGEPIGLHYESSVEKRRLNLDSVPPTLSDAGNFYFLPNAVLFQDTSGAVRIERSPLMQGREHEIRDGLQSGPAVLLNGQPHRFANPASHGGFPHPRRIFACVLSPYQLLIVYSRDGTTLPQANRFLSSQLGCRDAVFLDAGLTGIYIPGTVYDRPTSVAGVLSLTIGTN